MTGVQTCDLPICRLVCKWQPGQLHVHPCAGKTQQRAEKYAVQRRGAAGTE
nr:hypothetical protein [Enterococcus faecium]